MTIKTWITFNCSWLLGVLSLSFKQQKKCSKQIRCFRATLPHVCETHCLLKQPRCVVHPTQHCGSRQRRNPNTVKNSWTSSVLCAQVVNSFTAHVTFPTPGIAGWHPTTNAGKLTLSVLLQGQIWNNLTSKDWFLVSAKQLKALTKNGKRQDTCKLH